MSNEELIKRINLVRIELDRMETHNFIEVLKKTIELQNLERRNNEN